uniref:Uncharacterized protein n=1 Tax=Setaria digitata TaxID=48799 RepID=A0A915PVB5_9BILA
MRYRLSWMEGLVDARNDDILERDSVYRVDRCMHGHSSKKFSGVLIATTTAAVADLCKSSTLAVMLQLPP